MPRGNRAAGAESPAKVKTITHHRGQDVPIEDELKDHMDVADTDTLGKIRS